MLAWTKHEVGVMVTSNMATFLPNCTGNGLCATIGGCTGYLPPADAIQPGQPDTDKWVDSVVKYGTSYVLLVAHT